MISKPYILFYSCIAKGTTILGEFSNKEPGIESLASQCIEKTPPHHSMFSHTVRKRTYTFIIDDRFAYFAICSEVLEKSETLWFLNRVKCGFLDLIEKGSIEGSTDNLAPNCFQSQFDSIVGQIMALDAAEANMKPSPSSSAAEESRGRNLDISGRGKGTPTSSSHGQTIEGLTKKKRLSMDRDGDSPRRDGEKKVDMGDDNNPNGVYSSRDVKNGMLHAGDHHHHHPQKAKQMWRKHVWVVLILDLVICAILFGIWLMVCRGFQCIDG